MIIFRLWCVLQEIIEIPVLQSDDASPQPKESTKPLQPPSNRSSSSSCRSWSAAPEGARSIDLDRSRPERVSEDVTCARVEAALQRAGVAVARWNSAGANKSDNALTCANVQFLVLLPFVSGMKRCFKIEAEVHTAYASTLVSFSSTCA